MILLPPTSTLFPYTTLFRSRRRLLLQRLGEIGVIGLQLAEQPRVLDGDGRLVGEGLQQADLTVVEWPNFRRSEEHTSELQSRRDLVCRLLLEKKKNNN